MKPVVGFYVLVTAISVTGMGWAQTLTPSEQAASTERELTAAEKDEISIACSFAAEKKGTVKLSESLTADVYEIAPLRALLLLEFQPSVGDPGHVEVLAFRELPYGGISALHICEPIKIEPVVSGKGRARSFALRLADNLDLFEDYPNSAPLIVERNQLFSTQAGRYAVLLPRSEDEAETQVEMAKASDQVNRDSIIIHLTTGILVPLKPE